MHEVEQIFQGLQREARGISIEGTVPSRLDEIRNDLDKFIVETQLELRKEAVKVWKEDLVGTQLAVR